MIKKLFLVIFFILFLPLWGQQLTIYSDCNLKPYSYCEGDKVKGINIDILKSIFSKINGYSIKIKSAGLEKDSKKMKKDELLIINNPSNKIKKSTSIKDYTHSFIQQKEVLYCNKDINIENPKWPEDFNGTKVAIVKGFNINKNLQDAIDKGYIKIIEAEQKENLDNLIYKKVDCYINDELSIKGELLRIQEEFKKNDNNMSLDNIKKIIPISKKSYHVGFSNTNFPAKDYLIEKIDLAIKIMQNSQETTEIRERHLSQYLHPEKKRTIDVALYNWGDKLISDKLEGYGIIPEITSKAFELENIAVNYYFHHFNYSYLLTKWNKTCMTLPWLNIGDREKYFYFSDNIKTTAMYLFYNTKFNPEGSITNNLELYNVGGIDGYFYEKEIFEQAKTIQYTSFPNWNELIKALLSNKIDVIFAKKSTFYTHSKSFLESEKKLLIANENPLIRQDNYAIFSKKCKDSKELRDKFNRGFKRLKKRGLFDEILKKHNMTADEFDGIKDNRIDSDSDGVFNAYDKCKDTPKNIKVNNIGCERTVDPYTMKIKYRKNLMTIDGYISSMNRRNDFLDKLRLSYSTINIIDELSIDKGEPDGWIEFIVDIVNELKFLIDGSMKISGKDAYILGKLETMEEQKIFDKKLNKVISRHKNKGYKIKSSKIIILNTQVKICQEKFNTFIKDNKIIFDVATDIIKPENDARLKNLYNIAESCPKTKIHIIGHTDSTGNNQANKSLSLNRAKAVFKKLRKLGISPSKMKAIGKGKDFPIADNLTLEGREKNRRIEFKILGY